MKALFILTLISLAQPALAMTCKELFTVAQFKPKVPKKLVTEKSFQEIVLNINTRIKILENLVSHAEKKVVLSSQTHSREEFYSKVEILNEALELLRAYRSQIQSTHSLYSELIALKNSRGQELLNLTLKAYIFTKNSLLFPQVAQGLSQRHNESIELYKQVDLVINGADYLATSFKGLSRVVDLFSYRILELEPLNKRNSLKPSDLQTISAVIGDFTSYKEVLQHMVFKNYTSVQTAIETLQSAGISALKIINYAENKKDRLIEKDLNNYLESRNKFPYVETSAASPTKTQMKSFERQDMDIIAKILSIGVTPSHLTFNRHRFELLSEKAQNVFAFELPHRSYLDHIKHIENPLMFFWTQTGHVRFPQLNSTNTLEKQTASALKQYGINESNVWMYFDLFSGEAQLYFMQIAKQQLQKLEAIESL